MFIKLSDNRKKTLIFVGSFLSLAVLMIALVLAVGYIFFRSYGWFAAGEDVRATGMGVKTQTELFELAVVNDTTIPYDQHSPYTTNDLQIDYLEAEGYELIDETSASHMQLFFRLSNEKPTADVSEDENAFSPGDYGTVSFDIVPKIAGDFTFYIDLTQIGLKVVRLQNATETLEEVDDTDGATDFLKGHILFFRDRDRVDPANSDAALGKGYHYRNLISDHLIEYALSEHTADRVTVNGELHYRVTFYWVWPSTFAQIAFPEGDVRLHSHALFGVQAGSNNAAEAAAATAARAELMEYIADNNGLFFKDLAAGAYTNAGDENTHYVELSDGYNNADQVIGEEVSYYVLKADVSIDPPETPAAPEPEPEPEPEP